MCSSDLWTAEGHYRLGSKGMVVNVIAFAYLLIMFINLVIPTGLGSPRGALFNLDWVTLMVIFVLAIVGFFVNLASRAGKK